MPEITVAILTYNRVKYLTPAIESVLKQTFTDFELLILDNSSTDNTESLVKSFSDQRIRYIKHPPVSPGVARNIGLENAKGKYVGYLDDDDIWLPEKLASQLAAFQSSPETTALVYGGYIKFDDTGREFGTHNADLNGKILKQLLWSDPFTGSASNPLMRTDVMRSLGGYDPACLTSEDWEFYLRLADKYEIQSVPQIVLKIRHHTGARLGDPLDASRSVEENVLKMFGSKMGRRLRSYYLQKIGGKLIRTGKKSEGRKKVIQAVIEWPFNIVAYGQFFVSFLGASPYMYLHKVYQGLRGR